MAEVLLTFWGDARHFHGKKGPAMLETLQKGEVREYSVGPMRTLHQAWLLFRNDLRQEFRRWELVMTAGFFTLVLLLMFALAFDRLDESTQMKVVPGMLWITVAFVGALTLSRVFEREREASTFLSLMAAPVDRLALYLGKMLTSTAVLLLSCAILLPGLAFFFPGAEKFLSHPGESILLVFLGIIGYTSLGTLFAASLATSSGKNVLLSVILYPLTTPMLLLGVVATQRLLLGHPHFWNSIGTLFALDVALMTLAAFIFEFVLIGSRPRHDEERTTRSTLSNLSKGVNS